MSGAAIEDGLLAQALDKAREARRLDDAEAQALWSRADIHELGSLAAARRRQLLPEPLGTFLIDRNINYTNVCVTDCQFCAFYRTEGHPESYTLSFDQIAPKIEETVAVGGTRILMQGGHNPQLRLAYYQELLRAIADRWPDLAIDAFSPSEVEHLAQVEDITVESTLRALQEAGLTGLPGGGAEILHDEVRHRIAPKKQRAEGWLDTMRIAQELGLATSATMVIGFGETFDHRIHHLRRLRELQDQSQSTHGNGFTSFIVWTAQLKHNSLGRSSRVMDMGATAFEYLRFLALSRLYLDNVTHISASWPTLGDKIAEVALCMGADDFGSTMLEENVVSASGTTRTSMTADDIKRHIRNAGLVPAQRDTRYRILRRFD